MSKNKKKNIVLSPTDLPITFNNNQPKLPDNQMYTPSGKIITFNEEQYEGIKKIRQWLKGNENFFTLSGYAGTGKSLCVKKLTDEYNWGVVVSAPTHKARKVVENFTGLEGKTIHSLLGLRPNVEVADYDPNNPEFAPIALPKICDYSWVILDEASMINNDLFYLIQDKIKNSKTKVLFIGDPAQIPPISEKESIIFSQPNIQRHHLTKIERQQDTNPLMFIYDDIRNNLNSLDGGFFRKSNMNNLGEGVIFTTNKEEFRKAIIEKYKSEEFHNNSDYVKTIAWRNITVMQSNNIIRTALLGENIDVVEVGDLLMAYRTVSNDKQSYNIIENSADYHVIKKSIIQENKYDIKGFIVNLREDLSHGKFKFEDVFIVDTKDHDNLHAYAERHDYFRDMAKENKKLWKLYYEFRRNNLIMTNIDHYRNGLERGFGNVINKDIDVSYCVTAHKVQGSSYEHVYILENDIRENWLIRERNQIFYVAISRPRVSAMVLTNKIDQ